MTEQHQARDLLATLRDALQQLDGTLGRMREGIDDVASQATRLRESVEALGTLWQREATAVGIDLLIDTAVELIEVFRELETGLFDAQGDVDTLEATLADDEDGRDA